MKLDEDGSELSLADLFLVAMAKANGESFWTQDSGFVGTYDKIAILER